MKDVVDCDKPGAGVKQPLIPGCPNGETWRERATESRHPRMNA